MNPDEIKSLTGQVATMLFALLTGAGVMNAAQASTATAEVTIAVPALLMLGSIAVSIWRKWNMKQMPEKATAIMLPTKPPVGSSINLTPLTGVVKVVA